jgi:hypothetical protein
MKLYIIAAVLIIVAVLLSVYAVNDIYHRTTIAFNSEPAQPGAEQVVMIQKVGPIVPLPEFKLTQNIDQTGSQAFWDNINKESGAK